MANPKILLKLLSLSIAISLGSHALTAQGTKVVVQGLGDRELKGAAHRLRVSVEHLRQARQVLREATELALQPDFPDKMVLGQIAGMYGGIDLPKAAQTQEAVLHSMMAMAASAKTPEDYRQASGVAGAIVTSLLRTDPDRAATLFRQWPVPPATLREAGQTLQQEFEDRFSDAQLRGLIWEDPDQALRAMSERRGRRSSPSMQVELIQQLVNRGRRAEAEKLLDAAVSEFQQSTPDFPAVQAFRHLAQSVNRFLPDKAPAVFSALVQQVDRVSTLAPGSTLEIGGKSIALDAGEVMVFELLASVRGQPDTARKFLQTVPRFQQKLDSIGGLEALQTASRWRLQGEGGSRSATRLESVDASVRNPALFRQKLTELATPERVQELLQLAQMTVDNRPDAALQALDTAENVVFQVEPLQRRAQLVQALMDAYSNVEGELQPSFLKKGFALLNQLRESEVRQPSEPANNNRRRPSDTFETLLVAEWARIDFAGARTYVQAVDNPSFKVQALLRIASALAQR